MGKSISVLMYLTRHLRLALHITVTFYLIQNKQLMSEVVLLLFSSTCIAYRDAMA